MNGRRGEGNEYTNKILPHKDNIYIWKGSKNYGVYY